ncbi:hypothetical protein BDK51DRAFT_51485 [Blyttiomyces helicus]|uniref:Uncharacterized protein n=1 Tax=Blyttiomyces helicus TaxID=388810 RepID=A0A4P9WKN4_9FUNG|nr:hypothetical protein BDK51DRAFT_51485 [Blyttiomyces helicus]|eukprot:RKO92138.1 hypothetical protein BDK51DRAFT_51485 [Blyttiomyces helicus]
MSPIFARPPLFTLNHNVPPRAPRGGAALLFASRRTLISKRQRTIPGLAPRHGNPARMHRVGRTPLRPRGARARSSPEGDFGRAAACLVVRGEWTPADGGGAVLGQTSPTDGSRMGENLRCVWGDANPFPKSLQQWTSESDVEDAIATSKSASESNSRCYCNNQTCDSASESASDASLLSDATRSLRLWASAGRGETRCEATPLPKSLQQPDPRIRVGGRLSGKSITTTGPPAPSPMVRHRSFNPDRIALIIISGAKQLGLEPFFSQPYTAFVLSDAEMAEKFMSMVVEKSAAMGHPDTRAIRTIGVSFETKNQSGHAPLTMALAESLVAIFEPKSDPLAINSFVLDLEDLHCWPASPNQPGGRGGEASVFNFDDNARANHLPDDSLRSLASHVGVLPAAEDGQPHADGHLRNADAALVSLSLHRALLRRPDVGNRARPSAHASDSAPPSSSNRAPASTASDVRLRAHMELNQFARVPLLRGGLRGSRGSSGPTPTSDTTSAHHLAPPSKGSDVEDT